MSFEFVSYFGFRASNLHFCLTLASFAPWNTDSTKIVLFSRSAIPQGESHYLSDFLNPNSTENFKYV